MESYFFNLSKNFESLKIRNSLRFYRKFKIARSLLNLSLHKHPIFLCCSSLFSAFLVLSLYLAIPTYIFLPFRVTLSLFLPPSLSYAAIPSLKLPLLLSALPILHSILFLRPSQWHLSPLFKGVCTSGV